MLRKAKKVSTSIILHSKCTNNFNTKCELNVKINNLSTFYC